VVTAAPQHAVPDLAPASARWELLRALGAAVLTPPPGNVALCEALDLSLQTGAEHTHVFVLSAPPHAAIYLGPEGKLGGEGLDRISGFWRALGLQAPEDADHLGTLLLLYAELGEAETGASSDKARSQMRQARTALLHEHLWSWAPGYLAAVRGLGVPSVTEWAQLVEQALRVEVEDVKPAALLPLALRQAPSLLGSDPTFDETLDVLVAPICSGMILTYPDLEAAAASAGLGVRRGERRYALKAMFEQDAAATLLRLAAHAEHWSAVHAAQAYGVHDACSWWSARAARTSSVLTELADRVSTSGQAS